MNDDEEQGAPYPSPEAGPVDEWSARAYAALRDWPVAAEGVWTRWEPGYVLLIIERLDGEDIEPIALDTADEELTVTLGYWEMNYPDPFELPDAEPETAVDHARALVEQWLSGEIRTAVLSNTNGKWCGSTLIEPGAIEPQLRKAADWLRDFHPTTIEVRAPRRADWRHYTIDATGIRPT